MNTPSTPQERVRKPRIFGRLLLFPRVQFTMLLHGLVYVLPTVVAILVLTLSNGLPFSVGTQISIYFLVFLAFAALLIYGLVLTHRIVGPIYRIMQHMRETAEKKTFSPIEFREKDEFSELSKTYNVLLETLLKK